MTAMVAMWEIEEDGVVTHLLVSRFVFLLSRGARSQFLILGHYQLQLHDAERPLGGRLSVVLVFRFLCTFVASKRDTPACFVCLTSGPVSHESRESFFPCYTTSE